MKTLVNYISAIVLAISAVSCLDLNDVPEPTAAEEQSKLKEYLDNLEKKGNNIDTTAAGVYYVKITEGTGEKAKQGDTLTVGYAGYYLNGYVFDASYWHNQVDSTFTFVLGDPPLIKGWEDSMKLMNKNSKYQFVIPSSLAYGSEGSGMIPAYQSLVFVVIMKDLKPKN